MTQGRRGERLEAVEAVEELDEEGKQLARFARLTWCKTWNLFDSNCKLQSLLALASCTQPVW
jgi:hypothetical protein